jgi:hypothetical protein
MGCNPCASSSSSSSSSTLAKFGSGFKRARNTPPVLDSWLAGAEIHQDRMYFGPAEDEFLQIAHHL